MELCVCVCLLRRKERDESKGDGVLGCLSSGTAPPL